MAVNSSSVSRSIFEAQSVIRKGARKRIGNNCGTNVRKEPWLVDPTTKFVSMPIPNGLVDTTVNQLMEVGAKVWDEGLIRDIFPSNVVTSIFNVPLSRRNVCDSWVWKHEARGIWKVQAPLHAKFFWRSCSGFLPTVDTLATKKVFINSTFPVCGYGDESVLYLCVQCKFAKECWRKCRSWLSSLSVEDVALVAMTCWFLWINKNNVVWAKKKSMPSSVVCDARYSVAAWTAANSQQLKLRLADVGRDDWAVVWKALSVGWWKVNVDVAVFPEQNRIEIVSLREALSWLKGRSNVSVEPDLMEVILEVRNPELSKQDVFIENYTDLAKQLVNFPLFL
ncbi:uncharacterized protein LOC126678498 [Mercurialis annua]|uniref:uncharacterized protein LOC126678498 n=1 Tax=Mercurialis annua TaxID=3986 RepID=UPI002160327B|nr:uncharacterized protein LOC126678498 [Mercurialis annua]